MSAAHGTSDRWAYQTQFVCLLVNMPLAGGGLLRFPLLVHHYGLVAVLVYM
jgi:hypothetical protein